jgi:hypothetical protein
VAYLKCTCEQSNILGGLLRDRDDDSRCGGHKVRKAKELWASGQNRTVIMTQGLKVDVIVDTESSLCNIFGDDVGYIIWCEQDFSRP